MKIDRRITGGLAWAGLVVILAVPSADILFGKPTVHASITSDMSAVRADTASVAGDPGSATAAPTPAVTAPAQTASVAPDKPATSTPATNAAAAPASADPAPTQVASAAPAQPTSTPTTPATQPQSATTVATAQPQEDPPVPMPRSMRPTPVDVAAAPADEFASASRSEVATAAPSDGQPLILDDSKVRHDQATADASPDFFGPSKNRNNRNDRNNGQVIGQDKLQAWNSGSLADYLQRNGLLDENSPPEPQIDDSYDPNGFFLSDGPNGPRRYRREPDQSWYF